MVFQNKNFLSKIFSFSWENKEEAVYTKQIFKRNSFSKYTEICEGFTAFKVPVENAFIYGNKFPE